MATNTTNYGWTKPSYEDAADIEVINGTIDNIDAQLKTVETALNSKQNALSSAQLVAVNSGIDSTKVAQITTNKNNILLIVDWLNSLNQNLSPVYGGISEANKFIVNNTAITLPAGTYTISWVSAAKTGTTVVSVFNGSDRVVNQNVSNATDDSCTFTIASACDKFNIYTSVANTISNLKIIASS